MKRLLLIVLVALIITGCCDTKPKDSFEKYIEWCEEIVEKKESGYQVYFDYTGYRIKTRNANGPYTMVNYNRIDYPIETLDELTLRVLEVVRDTSMSLYYIDRHEWNVESQREEPTIEGYQRWKDNKEDVKYKKYIY